MISHFNMTYVIFAKRTSIDQPWSEWSKSEDKATAERLEQNAIDSGYLAKIVTDRDEIRRLRTKANKYFYSDEDESPKVRWYFQNSAIVRGDRN